MKENFDLIVVGGGLAGGLLAYRVKSLFPETKLLLLEKSESLGGTHTWSFHTSDVGREALSWLRPLLSGSWENYEVRFPSFTRSLTGGYHSLRSETFHSVLSKKLGDAVRFGAQVVEVRDKEVELKDGTRLTAGAVLDARGFLHDSIGCGYQKFLGLDLSLEHPHGLSRPVLMDATVSQEDGYRFFYVLPWSDHSVLIEQTHYSDTPSVDRDTYRASILAYAHEQGWKVAAEDREEVGSLPIPFGAASKRAKREEGAGIAIGTRAGLFHPTTGYSLPDAVRLVDEIARTGRLDLIALRYLVQTFRAKRSRGRSLYYFLNRMLFEGAEPENRRNVLERFYRLPEPVIQRFYASELKISDGFRLLSGKPPIPIGRAVACLWPKGGRSIAQSST